MNKHFFTGIDRNIPIKEIKGFYDSHNRNLRNNKKHTVMFSADLILSMTEK